MGGEAFAGPAEGLVEAHLLAAQVLELAAEDRLGHPDLVAVAEAVAVLALPVLNDAFGPFELVPDAEELGFEGFDAVRPLFDLGGEGRRLGFRAGDLGLEPAHLRGQGDDALGLLPDLHQARREEQVSRRRQEVQLGMLQPDLDRVADVGDDDGVLEPGQAVPELLVGLDQALELSDDAGPRQDVGRDGRPGRGRNERVAAPEAFRHAAEELLGRDDPRPGPFPPERVEEAGVLRARPDEVGQDAEPAGHVVGPALLAALLVDLPQGLEVIGGFVALGLQGLEPAAGLFGGRAGRAEGRLDVLGPADEVLPQSALSGDVAQHGGQARRVLEQEPVLLAQLGRELLFLAQEQLELLVGLDAFVLGLGQGLQGLEVALAQAVDLVGAGEARLPGFVEPGLGPGDLGPLGAELFLESREAGLVIFDLTGQEEDVLEKLVAVGLGALLRLLEILDPFRLALDVALDTGGLGPEGEELLLAFLERFFPVPKVLAAGGGVLFHFAQAGRGLVLADEALFVEPRGLLPGLFEDDELPLVVVGGQLADALAQAPVAVGRLGLALEGVLGLLDLDDDVLEPDEVLPGAVELRLGLALLVLVISGAGGLLDEQPLLGRLGGDEAADRALLDDEVIRLADGVLPELVLDVPEADGLAVHPVLALAGAEGPVGDVQLLVVAGQGQDGVGHAEGGTLGVAGEDDLIGPVAADGLLAVPAEGPEHGVDEVALARAVGADDGGDAGVEDDLGPLGEGLESLQFELLDDHAHGVEALSVECPGRGAGRNGYCMRIPLILEGDMKGGHHGGICPWCESPFFRNIRIRRL